MNIKKIINFSMLLSLSVVLSILESLIPFFNLNIPGLKIGLPNILIVYSLYKFNLKDTFYLSILRVILVGMLRTGIFSISFFLSLSGALFSIIMMNIAKKMKFSIIGVSIIGAICHIIGQMIMASILLNNVNLLYYLPYLLLFSIITGAFTGTISRTIIKRTNNL